jgi:SAM-dependent methyltransferase
VEAAQPYAHLASVYDEIVVDPCYGVWAEYLHGLWVSDATTVRSVLDVGCGTGLMAQALMALGYDVVGVDASSAMLARARELLGPDAGLHQRTLPDLDMAGVFDAAVSTFDALNYLTPADLRATLTAVAERLRPGGWLIFDLHTDAMLDFTTANPIVSGAAGGKSYTISSLVDPANRTCDTRIEVTSAADLGAFAEQHRQYFHRASDVLDALLDAGYSLMSVNDEYSPEPADASTLRATWTARRTREDPNADG